MRPAVRDALALAFAALFPSVMAWLYFVELAGDGEPNRVVLLLYGVGKLVQFPFPLLYVLLFERDRHAPRRPSLAGLGPGIAFALLTDLAMAALYFGWLRDGPLLAGTPGLIFGKLREMQADTPGRYLLLGLFLCLLHSGLEEYYWRWFVFGWMRRYLPFAAAAVLSGLAFMAHHVIILGVYFPGRFWTLALPFSLGVAVGGIVWAWLYERNGTLLAPWVSHALIDAGILLVGYDLVRGLW